MNNSKNAYWEHVGERLKRLSKAAFNMSISVAVDAGIEKVCCIIDEKLHEVFKRTFVNSVITLVLNIIGILVVLFLPFDPIISGYIGAGLFLGSIVFFLIRVINYIRSYGKTTIGITNSIIGNRSISKGIEAYVYTRFPLIAFTYTGIECASVYIPELKQVPSLNKTIKLIIQIFWEKIMIFSLIMTFYSFFMYWIVKPLLLQKFANLAWYKVYFYPLCHIYSIIKG